MSRQSKLFSGALVMSVLLLLFQNCSTELRPATGAIDVSKLGEIGGLNTPGQNEVKEPVLQPKGCAFNSLSLANGESATGFRTATVPFGSSCESSPRTCSNGVLGGDPAFQYNSCTVAAAKSCSFNTATVAHGTSVPGYTTPTAPCVASPRSCVNGVLGGNSAHQYNTCNNSAPVSTCRPVRKIVRTLGNDRALNCGGKQVIFDEVFAEYGRAVVRANLVLAGSGQMSAGLHGWSAEYIAIGEGSTVAQGAGEDLCPNENLNKSFLAFGKLSAAKNRITLGMNAYQDPACVNGTIVVKASSTLEVWIEDPAAACAGKDIAYASYFENLLRNYGTVVGYASTLDYNYKAMVGTSITTTAPATIRVLSMNEVSPAATTNTCGNRAQYASGHILLNGAQVSQENVGYPTSGGMTHALISNEYAGSRAAGTYTAVTGANVNQAQQLGALCGYHNSGDSNIAIIVER